MCKTMSSGNILRSIVRKIVIQVEGPAVYVYAYRYSKLRYVSSALIVLPYGCHIPM